MKKLLMVLVLLPMIASANKGTINVSMSVQEDVVLRTQQSRTVEYASGQCSVELIPLPEEGGYVFLDTDDRFCDFGYMNGAYRKIYPDGTKVHIHAIPKPGYDFAGWYTDSNCSQRFEGRSDVNNDMNNRIWVQQDCQLWAKFIINNVPRVVVPSNAWYAGRWTGVLNYKEISGATARDVATCEMVFSPEGNWVADCHWQTMGNVHIESTATNIMVLSANEVRIAGYYDAFTRFEWEVELRKTGDSYYRAVQVTDGNNWIEGVLHQSSTVDSLDSMLEVIPGETVSFDTGLIGYTAKGLPSGLKYDKKTGKITGAAKKPTAAEGVTVKFTKKGEADVTMTVVVGPIPTINVTLEGDTEKCKVTGGNKAYLVGKNVSLQAKGPKGTAFVGWFKDGEPWPSAEESKNTKLSYVMTKESISLVATFEKEKMSVACPGLASASFTVGVAGGAGIPIEIETQSGVKLVKVTKLPAGMKYNAKTGLIEGAPTKAGSFDVTIKVTAKSGAVETLVVPVTVAALPDWAVGTFVGLVRQVDYDAQGNVVVDGDGRHDWYDVEIVVTVSVKGKISGKLKFPGNSGTGSFSAAAFSSCCEDGCVATGILKLGKNKGTVGLRVAPRALTARGSDLVGDVEVFCRGTASRTGYLITGSTDESHPLRQQIWKSKTLPLPPSIDKKSVAIERDGHLYTLSFGKSGAVDDTLASADNPKKVVKKGKPVFSVIGYWDSAWHCELFGTPIIDTTEGGGERIRFDVCIAHDGSLCCTPAE